MSGPIAEAAVELVPSTRGFGRRTVSDLTGEVGQAGKKLGSGFGKAFGIGAGLLAGAGLASFFKGSVEEAREAQKVGKVTTAVIKATGGAAKVSAKQVGDLASAISAKTGIDDEAIQAGTNLLLTFKSVRNETGKGAKIFDRATQAGVDLAATGFGSITGNAKLLGAALNDPIKGLGKLRKAGVTFTEAQEEQIKALVKSGDILSAQKILLDEVEGQVGGAAAASATAGEKAAVAFGNLKEQIGTALLPVIDRVANFLSRRMIPALGVIAETIQNQVIPPLRRFVDELISRLGPAADKIRKIFAENVLPVLRRVGDFLRDNPDTVKAFAIALGVLAAAIGIVTLATTAFSIALNSTGIPLVIIAIAALVAGLVYAYKNSEQFRTIVNQVGAALRDFGGFLRAEVLPVVQSLASKIGDNLRPILAQLGETFRTDVLPFLTQVVAKFREAQPTIQKVIGFVVRLAAQYLAFVATVLGRVIPALVKFAGFVIRNIIPAISAYIAYVRTIIRKTVEFGTAVLNAARDAVEFARKVKRKIEEVVTAVKGMPGKAKKALGDLKTYLLQAGRDLIQGMINGVKEKASDLVGAAKDAVGGAVKGAKNLLGIKSPSRVFKKIGNQTIDGLTIGISEKRQKVVDAARTVVDGLRDQFRSIKDEARSLGSSVADSFRPDLFSGGTAEFFSNGAKGLIDLKRLKQAFLRLRKFGLGKKFLTELFSSGNTGLILQLASGSRGDARAAQNLFGQTNTLASQLGSGVGQNQFGGDIDRLGARLEKALTKLERAVKGVGKDVGSEVNGAATKGRRDRKR